MNSTAPQDAAASTVRAAAPRKRSIVLLTGAFIFVCGAIAGAGLTIIVLDNMMSQRFRHPELMVNKIMDELTKNLALTPEQRPKVENILQKNREEMDRTFREEIRPKVDARFDALKNEIAAVLTEKQAADWKRDFEQLRRRFGPPAPPDMPR